MAHATVVVSGTKIAEEIATSRSEVWRLVQQLRALGVSIGGHTATGYRLQAVPDLLLPDVLSPLVQGTIFDNQIHHYYKIGSTNTVAMEAGNAGAPEGSVFLAERQIAGRTWRAQLVFRSVGWDLLLGRIATRTAAIGSADSFPGCWLGGAFGYPGDCPCCGCRFEVAQRCVDPWEENCRYPDRDEFRSDSRPLHRDRNRNQRQPDNFSVRTAADGNLASPGHGHGMVARGSVRVFAKIAQSRIS